MLPCRLRVAVLVTIRWWDHRNASRSSCGIGSVGGACGQEPFQWLVLGLAVDSLVVDGLDPCSEQLVQPGQVSARLECADSSEEVAAGARRPPNLLLF